MYLICVLDAENELSFVLLCEEIIEEGSTESTKVQRASRRWRKANSNFLLGLHRERTGNQLRQHDRLDKLDSFDRQMIPQRFITTERTFHESNNAAKRTWLSKLISRLRKTNIFLQKYDKKYLTNLHQIFQKNKLTACNSIQLTRRRRESPIDLHAIQHLPN